MDLLSLFADASSDRALTWARYGGMIGGVIGTIIGGALMARKVAAKKKTGRFVIRGKRNSAHDDIPMVQPVSSRLDEAFSEIPLVQAVSSVMAHILFPGQWFLVDALVDVHFDGRFLGKCSVKEGFHFNVETVPGRHEVTVKLMIRSAKTYHLDFTRPGEYTVQIAYSTMWGNFASKCEVRSMRDSGEDG